MVLRGFRMFKLIRNIVLLRQAWKLLKRRR